MVKKSGSPSYLFSMNKKKSFKLPSLRLYPTIPISDRMSIVLKKEPSPKESYFHGRKETIGYIPIVWFY